MTSPTEVRDVLKTSPDVLSFVSSDHIKAFNLPEELVKDTDHMTVLITDIRNQFNRFASDHAQGRYSTVQIQAWFSSDDDIDAFERAVNKTLEDNGWYNNYDAGIDTDPDTLQLYMTKQYSKNNLKGNE